MTSSASSHRKNPIEFLVSSLTRHKNNDSSSSSSSSYLILLQHSLQATRLVSWADYNVAPTSTSTASNLVDNDQDKLYRQARIRTPLENSVRDATGHLWLHYLFGEFVKTGGGASSSSSNCNCSTRIIYVSTTGGSDPLLSSLRGLSESVSIDCLDASSNPYGWSGANDNNGSDNDGVTLEDLGGLLQSIEKTLLATGSNINHDHDAPVSHATSDETTVVLLESLSPLLMRHGVARTFQWLRRLCSVLHCPIVLPILVETLSSTQHQALEDMAQAVLSLHQGEMTLIRHGIREKGNVVRQPVPFRLVRNDPSGEFALEVGVDDTQRTEQPADHEDQNTLAPQSAALDMSPRLPSRPGKVALKLEDDIAAGPAAKSTETSSQPRIYMQDDDPEFDDFDEDDPDDDLDI